MKTKLILLSTILLFSCGARKTSKSETTEKVKTETEIVTKETETKQSETNTNVKETKSTTIDKENNIVSEVTEITTDDKTKPASVKLPNGQIIDITNAKYRNEKTIDLSKENTTLKLEYNKAVNIAERATKIAETLYKQNKELLNKLQDINSERKQFNYGAFILSFWWFWLLIIAMIYIGWKNRKTLFM